MPNNSLNGRNRRNWRSFCRCRYGNLWLHYYKLVIRPTQNVGSGSWVYRNRKGGLLKCRTSRGKGRNGRWPSYYSRGTNSSRTRHRNGGLCKTLPNPTPCLTGRTKNCRVGYRTWLNTKTNNIISCGTLFGRYFYHCQP